MLTTSSKIRGYSDSDLFYAKVIRIEGYRIIAVDDYYGNTIHVMEPNKFSKLNKGIKLFLNCCNPNDIILVGKILFGFDATGNNNYRYNVLYKYSHEEIPKLNIHYKRGNY